MLGEPSVNTNTVQTTVKQLDNYPHNIYDCTLHRKNEGQQQPKAQTALEKPCAGDSIMWLKQLVGDEREHNIVRFWQAGNRVVSRT